MRDGTPARERQFRPQIVRKGQTRLKGSTSLLRNHRPGGPLSPGGGERHMARAVEAGESGGRERRHQARARAMACRASPTAAPTTVPLMRMYCRSRPRSSSSWLDVSAASHRSIVPVTSPASSSWN
jgi:hypothetical protein